MQYLYTELWRKAQPLNKDFSLRLPEPASGMLLAYMVSLSSSINESLVLGQYESTKVEKKFKILDDKVEISYRMGEYLVWKEDEDIYSPVVHAEVGNWVGASANNKRPAGYVWLNYKISGEPKSGI